MPVLNRIGAPVSAIAAQRSAEANSPEPIFHAAMGRTTGAAVLPVSALRLSAGRFEVTIGAPIAVPEGADGNPDYAAAVQAYADWVTSFVLRDPGQWRGWRYTSPSSS